jgi:hypothetical protein
VCVIYEIYLDRASLIKKAGIDKVGHTLKFEYLILFIWLIQSHSQRGSPSANLGNKDPNG